MGRPFFFWSQPYIESANALSDTDHLDKLVSNIRKKSDLWQSLGKALKVPEEKLATMHCQTDFESMMEQEISRNHISTPRSDKVLTVSCALEVGTGHMTN